MKNWLLMGCFFWTLAFAGADEVIEVKAKVIALEKEMAVALVAGDTDRLLEMLAEDFLVNNPANRVLTHRDEVMERIDSGIIRYDAFEQSIEEVRVYEGQAISIPGSEELSSGWLRRTTDEEGVVMRSGRGNGG